MFGVDAGCYFVVSPDTPCPASLYWFDHEPVTQTGLPGYFSSTHELQNMVPLQESSIKRKVSCGLEMLFEADVLPASELGQELRSAQASGGTACPAE